jgi:hypothetical protein
MKIRLAVLELKHTDRQTDTYMTKEKNRRIFVICRSRRAQKKATLNNKPRSIINTEALS